METTLENVYSLVRMDLTNSTMGYRKGKDSGGGGVVTIGLGGGPHNAIGDQYLQIRSL
jgi:hypothetical protein